MLTTHMDPQLTGSDVVTTEDGHLLTLNQVMELGKIEHKFKPTIVKKEFNWELPADPDPKSDNYYNGIVSKELGGLQQYRGDPPWGYPQRVSQESV